MPLELDCPDYDGNDLPLPGFISRRPDGVHVDLGQLPSREEFERIVDRVFSTGHIFRGLDYERFHALLYQQEALKDAGTEIRLADEVKLFPHERYSLYRSIKSSDTEAEYVFEPVELVATVEVPIHAVDSDGQQTVVGTEDREVYQRAELDFDEFIAYCWSKGIRYGIDAPKVRELIQTGRTERVTIARALAPTDGADAGVEEQPGLLHRDNRPRMLADGRVDLGQYANRFPQVHEGMVLLTKTPRQLGEPGRSLDGHVIEPPMPKDFELATLSGDGTAVEWRNNREVLIATMNGFLNIDAQTNKISITEKIINRDGVSTRTTGSLSLEGNEYEEFGEVQEGRTVEGRNLTFHANVYGRVASAGGKILLERNLVGGMAVNRAGEIIVQGIASSSLLRVGSGTVKVTRAENCILMADRVEIETAFQCTVLAEEIEIGVSEGSAVCGKQVHVAVARAHGNQETVISMLMPDLKGYRQLQDNDLKYIEECEDLIKQLKQGLAVMTTQPDLQQYLQMAGKIRRKETVLGPEQIDDWKQTTARMAPAMKRINQAREDIQALESEIGNVREHIDQLETEKQKASTGVALQVDLAQGEVVARTLVVPLESPALTRLPPRELQQRLRNRDPGEEILFSGSGNFVWEPAPPVDQVPVPSSQPG